MYASLVTSGVPLTEARFAALAEAGLDHVQLSVQDDSASSADVIAGIRAHDRKLSAAAMVTGHGLPLTLNVVLHRGNIRHVAALAELAERMGADRLELANTQYYGWARLNRTALLPTRSQVDEAERDVQHARARLGPRMEIVYVVADYHEERPKPCMYGWGIRQLIIAPNGDTLPCPAAGQIPGLGSCVILDGTFFRDEEMLHATGQDRPARAMGHLPDRRLIPAPARSPRGAKALHPPQQHQPRPGGGLAERATLEMAEIEVAYGWPHTGPIRRQQPFANAASPPRYFLP